ncbi:RES family NAD+ phosphorylase [Spirosoma panaciterrae]|uniref:RES family NAD+ phosphorylase n=1 Tax=Spirosoma panaciterrae TaxID=496058 RepID=UPI00036EC6D5|nr:RES family NAD+ phosphorylase [Spirosoma panaciterrae]
MPVIVYRVQTDSHRDTILDGIGAQLRGGRWNVRGRPLVYTATTPELCFLEYMVHLEGTPLADLPPLILCEIEIPDKSITWLNATDLPSGWNNPQITPAGLPQFMESQFREHGTLGVALPSAVVPLSPSRNVLIDPLHPLKGQCRIVRIEPYPIDPRLPTATLPA